MEGTAFLGEPLGRFEQQVGAVAQVFVGEALTPAHFRVALTALRAALNELGRESVAALVARAEEPSDTLERAGTVYRCKEVSPKEWFTPWGKVSVPRRLYQADRGGACVVPLDQRCGMVARFMVPLVERVCCLLGAQLVPAEVEQALAEIWGEGPSCTAIQQVLREVGQHAEEYAVECEVAVQAEQPLAPGGNALVAGWDGTMVPLRQTGPKRGRPARCPAHTATEEGQATTWKEAGVGMVAVYDLPPDPEHEETHRRDVRYFARTPEPKMVHLVDAVAAQVAAALAQGHFDHHLFLADGRTEIWRVVAAHPLLGDFTQLLDFYHACEHLSVVSEAIFAAGSPAAKRYFVAWRHRLRHRPNAITDLLRSLRRYAGNRRRSKVLQRELAYFAHNRHRMDYARLAALGLPIGSGPIEAACKTVVGHRLKRSGMRWTSEGAQQVLNLRAQLCSSRWDTFWNWHLQHTDQLAAAA